MIPTELLMVVLVSHAVAYYLGYRHGWRHGLARGILRGENAAWRRLMRSGRTAALGCQVGKEVKVMPSEVGLN